MCFFYIYPFKYITGATDDGDKALNQSDGLCEQNKGEIPLQDNTALYWPTAVD